MRSSIGSSVGQAFQPDVPQGSVRLESLTYKEKPLHLWARRTPKRQRLNACPCKSDGHQILDAIDRDLLFQLTACLAFRLEDRRQFAANLVVIVGRAVPLADDVRGGRGQTRDVVEPADASVERLLGGTWVIPGN